MTLQAKGQVVSRTERGMKIDIGLTEQGRRGSVEILNAVLSDLYLLYTKTRNYHWNVTGPRFNDLHKFFEAQYEQLNQAVDDVAERVRSLGGRSLGTMREFIDQARLEENPGEAPPAQEMIAHLLADHEAVIRGLRKDVDRTGEELHDLGTQNFLQDLLEGHEKMAWMLRAFLVGESP